MIDSKNKTFAKIGIEWEQTMQTSKNAENRKAHYLKTEKLVDKTEPAENCIYKAFNQEAHYIFKDNDRIISSTNS